jgi:hypothetical protein
MEAGLLATNPAEKEKKGPNAQVAPALGTPCLGPCGPRDMIDVRDNRTNYLKEQESSPMQNQAGSDGG